MKTRWASNELRYLCFGLFLLCPNLLYAGVPAPAPGTSVQPAEHQVAHLGDFQFENGEVIKDLKVSYVTHGKLSEKKDNVILGMHHGFGKHHQLDFLIGPGKPLDTDKYFIVETDMLGNSAALQDITTGPTNSGLKMRFPHFTIRDSVNVEYKFLKEYLGFDHILAAIGPSVGGMKTYQFGVSYPTYVSGLIPIAATPVTNHQTSTVLRSWMDIIELDSGWYGGNYQTNPLMAYHTMMWNLVPWVYTRQFFTTILKTEEAYDQFIKQWNNWLHLEPRDVRDVYYVLQAWANFNVGDTPGFNGDATAALETVQAQALIIGAKGDMLFGREENIFAENAIPKARYVEIDTPWGHLTCIGFDPDGMQIMSREISEFLSSLAAGAK